MCNWPASAVLRWVLLDAWCMAALLSLPVLTSRLLGKLLLASVPIAVAFCDAMLDRIEVFL